MTKLTLGYDSYLFSYKIGYQAQTKYLIQLRFMHNCVIRGDPVDGALWPE
jgi:hypothetical protein